MHKSLLFTALLFVAAAAAAASPAAEVVLRTKAVAHGPVLRLGDVADVRANNPSELNTLITTPLGPAPRGTEFLRAAEIRDLLAARGVNLRNVQFGGADQIEIRKPNATAAKGLDKANPAELAAQIGDLIARHLLRQTGHERWSVELNRSRKCLDPLLGFERRLTVSGGEAPWVGRQEFRIHRPGDKHGLAVAARVRRIELAVYATRPIAAGALVSEADVELRPHPGNLSSQAITSVDAVVGKEARRMILPDAMLSASQVRAPIVVSRGETIRVVARTGGVVVRTFATAKQDGAVGDLIQVEAAGGRQRYAARVSGRREAQVYAAANDASEFSLAN